jgi:hypothetical protein
LEAEEGLFGALEAEDAQVGGGAQPDALDDLFGPSQAEDDLFAESEDSGAAEAQPEAAAETSFADVAAEAEDSGAETEQAPVNFDLDAPSETPATAAADDAAADDASAKEKDAPAKSGSLGKILLILLVLVFLALGGGVAAVMYSDIEIPAWVPPQAREFLEGLRQTSAAPGVDSQAEVRLIMLENVRQYMVDNQRTGPLLVVEGQAVNNFPTAKELIKVEGSLYDDKGAVLATQEILCGNTLELYYLQTFSRAEVEAALSSEVGILAENTDLAPGAQVPFMLVFFTPPEKVEEVAVRVIQANDPS